MLRFVLIWYIVNRFPLILGGATVPLALGIGGAVSVAATGSLSQQSFITKEKCQELQRVIDQDVQLTNRLHQTEKVDLHNTNDHYDICAENVNPVYLNKNNTNCSQLVKCAE